MSNAASDHNMLFGILALQMNFVTRNQLVAGMQAWVLDKTRLLSDIFEENGHLQASQKDLLEALAQEHLRQHGDNPQASLAAVSSIKSVRQDLEEIADSDVAASLNHVSVDSDFDPYATQAEGDGGVQAEAENKTSIPSNRFRILRPHAKGGLGQVSVAIDEELHREVALKEIQERHADQLESKTRFRVEAEVTGRLEHPGIVPVYGLGTYGDGRPYYAMRFIRGDSLQSALENFHKKDWKGSESERSLELRKLLGRFEDVCNAIAYAHSRGVLHRDLKPGNIMLGKYGETLVVDWGLAKVQGQTESTDSEFSALQLSSGSDSGKTLPGLAIGTPAYMSPEQAEGRLEELGPTTDVYSLGATLYEILSGKRPFEGNDPVEILKRVAKGEITPLSQIDSQLPKPLVTICHHAMRLEPKDRYPTPVELANDIEKYLADEPVSVHRESFSHKVARISRKHRGVVQAISIAVILIAALSIGAAIIIDGQRVTAEELAEEKTNLSIELQDSLTEVEKSREREKQLRIVADEERDEAQRQLYHSLVSNVRELSARRPLAWTWDSLKILSRAAALSDQVDDEPETLRSLAADAASSFDLQLRHSIADMKPSCIAFTPDNKQLVIAEYKGNPLASIKFYDLATGSLVKKLTIQTVVGNITRFATGLAAGSFRGFQDSINSIAISDDRKWLAVGMQHGTIYCWNLDSRENNPTTWQAHKTEVEDLAFLPDNMLASVALTDPDIRIWDVAANGARVTEYGTNNKKLLRLDHREDRLWISSQSTIGSVDYSNTMSEVHWHPISLPGITSTALDRNHNLAVYRTANGLRLFDILSGKIIRDISEDNVKWTDTQLWLFTRIEISSDASFLISVGREQVNGVHVFDTCSGRMLADATTPGRIRDIGVSSDSQWLAVAKLDRVELFKIRNTAIRPTMAFSSEPIQGVGFTDDGNVVLTSNCQLKGQRSPLRLESLRRVQEVLPTDSAHSIVSSDGTRIWSIDDDSRIVSRSWPGGTLLSAWSNELDQVFSGTRGVNSLDISKEWVAGGTRSGAVVVLDPGTGYYETSWFGPGGNVVALSLDSQYGLAAVGTTQGEVELFRLPHGESADKLLDHADDLTTISFSPQSQYLATASQSGRVDIYHHVSGKYRMYFRFKENGKVMKLAFGPHEKNLAVHVEGEIAVRVWNLEELKSSWEALGVSY